MTKGLSTAASCTRCGDGRTSATSCDLLALPAQVRNAVSHRLGEPAVSGGSDPTYRQLVRAVDAAAEQLIAARVATGDVVGVASGRSAIAPVLILGVMAAGAVYLPLDPLYADALLTRMPTTGDVQTVVVDRSAAGRLPDGAFRVVPALTLLSATPVSRGRPTVRPCDAAYARFTSGSTGNPKGVLLARQPDLLRRLLAEHVDDDSGHCRVYTVSAQAGYLGWPCTIARSVPRASVVRPPGLGPSPGPASAQGVAS